MNLVLAVIDDLWNFGSSSVLRLLGITVIPGTRIHHHQDDSIVYVAPRPERLALEAPHGEDAPAPHAHLETVFEPVISAPQRNTVVYVSAHGAPLRNSPERGVDNVVARMPYGSMLVAMDTKEDWVRVFYRGVEGYVELHDLADRAAYVYPKFVIGEENHAYDPNTERVRAVIGDEFSYGEGALPLQAEEYVLYKLIRNGLTITWPAARPRQAGTWGRILEGTPGVTQSVEPRARGVMEWTLENGKGHSAFVEAVFPDGALSLSEANWPENGAYNERVLVREEWMRLSPTFLTIT